MWNWNIFNFVIAIGLIFMCHLCLLNSDASCFCCLQITLWQNVVSFWCHSLYSSQPPCLCHLPWEKHNPACLGSQVCVSWCRLRKLLVSSWIINNICFIRWNSSAASTPCTPPSAHVSTDICACHWIVGFCTGMAELFNTKWNTFTSKDST
jgi:hypothetical protein